MSIAGFAAICLAVVFAASLFTTGLLVAKRGADEGLLLPILAGALQAVFLSFLVVLVFYLWGAVT